METEDKKTISLIVPVYNEEENVPLLYQEIIKSWGNVENNYDYEIIFVNDGSSDQSKQRIKEIIDSDNKVRYIGFSRNFGKEMATTAGSHHAKGDALIMIDADLQHPPYLLPEFIKKWEEGNQIVIGVRNRHGGYGIFKKIGSVFFYKIMNRIGDNIRLIPFSTDYRLLDRCAIDYFNSFTERNRMTRGLINWLGFEKDFIYFDSPKRNAGTAAYSHLKLIKLALSSFVSYSLWPLKLAGYLGIFITILSGILGLYVLIGKYAIHEKFSSSFSGPAQLAIFTVFLVGIILTCLGLITLYIANIYHEVLNRPIYVIKEKENI